MFQRASFMLMILSSNVCPYVWLADYSVCYKARVDSYYGKAEEYDGCYDVGDHLEPLEPYLVVPAYCLECAPESVCKVEPESPEPDDVDDYYIPVSEGRFKEHVWIGSFSSCPFLELHVSPEMCEVECKDAEDDDTEDDHVLGCPGICPGLAGNCIAVVSSAGLQVAESKDEGIDDVDDETEGKYRHHYCHYRKSHEIASECEQSVRISEMSCHRVNYRKEIDREMKEEENDKKKSAYAHYELLAD